MDKIRPRHPEKVKNPVNPIKKKPAWIRSKLSDSKEFFLTKTVVNQNNLERIVEQINRLLRPEGKLIVIDFEGENRWHQLLITLMYLFFRLTTNIETDHLLKINAAILSKGLKMIHEEARIKGLIYSRTYHFNNFVK